MIIAGHQPNYLPYCGFFHKIAHCDLFAIVDTVQFVKRGPFGWQHRNRIRTKDGWMWLTVPVLTKGRYYQKINEVEINNDINWRRKHWMSIYLNYKKAPHFNKYSDFFEDLYKRNWDRLIDLNMEVISYLLKALKIDKKIFRCSELSIESGKSQLLVEMCNKFGSGTYLSGIHGRDYLDLDLIKRNNLKVLFQDFNQPVYEQLYNDFIPNLSVIDLLFNKGDESIDLILNRKEEAAQYVE